MKIIPNKYPEEKNWEKWLNFGTGKEVNKVFLYRTAAYIRDQHKKQAVIASGNRTMKQQQDLYEAYLAGKGNKAAKPGNSRHNYGLAIDFNRTSSKADGSGIYPGTLNADYDLWAKGKAEVLNQYGLRHAVTDEPWHIEPIELKGVGTDQLADWPDRNDFVNTTTGYPKLERTTPTTKGTFVRLLQEWVGADIDGSFGDGTKEKVTDYQKKKKITVDGVVGQGTWTALIADNKSDLDICQETAKDLTAQLADCQKQATDLTATNKELTASNKALTTSNKDLTDKNTDLTAKNTDLTAKNTDLTAKNTDLTTENKEYSKQIKALNQQLEVGKKEAENLEFEIVEKSNQVILLETQLNSKFDWIKTQESRIETFEKLIAKKDSEITKLQEKTNAYEKIIINREQDLAEKDKTIKSLNEKIESLESSIPADKPEKQEYSVAELLKMIIDRIFRRS